MSTQPSKSDANTISQTLSNHWSTRVHRHGHIRSVAEDVKREPIRGNFYRSIFQAHTRGANLENEADAYRDQPLGQLDRILRDTRPPTTDKGTQFGGKFFETTCNLLGLKHLTTTTYHPQKYEQAERCCRTLVARLRNYIAEHQRD